MGRGGAMRITTCANEAAGNNVRASRTASAIFFMVKNSSKGLSVSGTLHPFRHVEDINGLRGQWLRIHLEPHSQHFC
jgi:hypothetical protein